MRRFRTLQWMGLACVIVSGFWPTLRVDVIPMPPVPAPFVLPSGREWGRSEVPAEEIGTAFVEAVRGPVDAQPLWDVRRWYPWYLGPLWALALLATLGLAHVRPSRRRRIVGALLLLVTGGLIAFEAAYLRAEYMAFLPGVWGRVECMGAWLFVVALLLYRRREDRHIGAVEATVAAQALLGFVHGVTLPATMARAWLPTRGVRPVLEAVLQNFRPAFWVGMAGFLLLALPVLLRRSRGGAPGIEQVDS